MIIQEVINTIVQLTVVLLVASLAWALIARKRANWREWLGLTAPTGKAMVGALVILIVWSVVSAVVFLVPEFVELARGQATVAGAIEEAGFGPTGVALVVIMAVFKTALTEEIFFRGLVGKRLINGFGFLIGNTLQALIFGAIHLLIFLIPGGPEFSLMLAAALLLLPAIAGWLMGYANERLGNGSIAPGWLIHAGGNIISYSLLAFLL